MPKFDVVCEKMRAVEGVDEVDPVSFGRYEGLPCIDLHTRYFTERRLVPGERTYPFTPDIDPNQALEDARGTKFVRVMDNVVQYSQVVRDEGEAEQ